MHTHYAKKNQRYKTTVEKYAAVEQILRKIMNAIHQQKGNGNCHITISQLNLGHEHKIIIQINDARKNSGNNVTATIIALH